LNFYSLLEIEQNATIGQVKKAYRKQSMVLHPDKNPGDKNEVLYKLLTSVQAVLKDHDMRERYDQFLKKGFPVWRGLPILF
jgi:DnaJ family protein C protein 1